MTNRLMPFILLTEDLFYAIPFRLAIFLRTFGKVREDNTHGGLPYELDAHQKAFYFFRPSGLDGCLYHRVNDLALTYRSIQPRLIIGRLPRTRNR